MICLYVPSPPNSIGTVPVNSLLSRYNLPSVGIIDWNTLALYYSKVREGRRKREREKERFVVVSGMSLSYLALISIDR